MIKENYREAIEKDAKAYFDKIGRPDDGNEMRAYIAGATAEHDKVRNQAIQDCIDILINDDRIIFNASDWLEKFEKLKTIS